jgi:RNA polymerase primary sigma factor
MKAQTHELPALETVSPDQLWYAPDSSLNKKASEKKALEVVEMIQHRSQDEERIDDETVFAALHVCAHRASKPARQRNSNLSEKEAQAWLRRWQMIREYIVEQNLGLAYAMIGRFSSNNMDEDDLLSEAMLALTRAVDRFNPWKGYRFSTYACNVIVRALMRRGKRERNHKRRFPVQFDVSYEQPEELPDANKELYVERLERALDKNIGQLSDLETRILENRFPSDRRERRTFQEIGDAVGLSKERVRQIQNIAIRKLRQVLSSDPVLH